MTWVPRMLVSYHYVERGFPRAFEKLTEYTRGKVDLWADSGAFTAMTKGVSIDIDAYADWLHKYDDVLSAACTLDVIGDAEGTMRNTEYLWAKGCRVLPAYHMRSERWDIFDHIVDAYPYVCLGGMVGTGIAREKAMAFVVHCLRRARDRGSPAVFHALGLTDDYMLGNAPLYSADCSTWANGRRWGYLSVFDDATGKRQDVTLRDPQSFGRWGPQLREAGLDPTLYAHDDPPIELRDRVSQYCFRKQEEYTRTRLGEVRRPDRPDEEGGLRIYLAISGNTDYSRLMLLDDPFPHSPRAKTAVKRVGVQRGRKAKQLRRAAQAGQ